MASPSKSLINKFPSPNHTPLITSIIKTLISINPKPNSSPLNPNFIPQLSPFLNPNLVLKVINAQLNPYRALFFFNWASNPNPNPNNYTHPRKCYLFMYQILLSHHCFTTATQFIESYNLVSDFTVSIMIKEYGKTNQIREPIDLFYRFLNVGNLGNCVKSCNALLGLLVRANLIDLMRSIFERVVKEAIVELNVVSYTTVIRGYCKMGNVSDAQMVFDEMPCDPNLVTFSTLVYGYCRKGMVAEARQIVDMMVMKGGNCMPNLVTYTTLIDGYCKKGEMEEAMRCFGEMVGVGCEPNLVTYNVIVNGFCSVGEIDKARSIMSTMRNKGVKEDVVTHTSLLKGLCVAGRLNEALKHLRDMISFGMKPDIKAYGLLLNECCKFGKASEAINLLKEMIERGIRPGLNCFNFVLKALVEKQELDDAVLLLNRMPIIGFTPNFKSYSTVISSLSETKGRTEEVEELVHCMIRDGNSPDASVYSCRLKMFCKGGDLEMATRIFNESLDSSYAVNLDSFTLFMEELCARGMILEAEEHIQGITKRGLGAHLDNYRKVLNDLICKYKKS